MARSNVRARLARTAYSALLFALQPFYLLKLWRRGRVEPLYWHAVAERFGHYDRAPSSGWVWLHAVSLGETRAAAPLIDALRAARPGLRLLLSHGTATGRDAGRSLLREGDEQVWLPYDTPAAVGRFFSQFQPGVGVLMETEIWPNLLSGARDHGVPVLLANARLSAKSQRRGARWDSLLRPAAGCLAFAMAQTAEDARRLRTAGVREVVVSGNLKYDMTPDAAQIARGRRWRCATGRTVVLAASTREGEEAPLLAAWSRARAAARATGDPGEDSARRATSATGAAQPPVDAGAQAGPALLVVVPRHPQRFDEVGRLVAAAGLRLARRSAWSGDPDKTAGAADVWLGDSMGEMAQYYALADVALLGGSFAPLGGQNLIEAAACGCPVVMGPHTFNFADAAERSLNAGAALRTNDIDAAVDCALAAATRGRLPEMAGAALAFAAEHRGAARQMAAAIVARLR